MAQYRISHPGNIAIEEIVWTLNVQEGKATLGFLNTDKGGYWHQRLVKPLRRAIRNKANSFTVCTAGFTSGEFSNVLFAAGCTMDRD